MDVSKGQNLLEFSEWFKTDLDCKEYLGQIKWKSRYVCPKCGNTSYQVRKDYSRTCNSCSDTESPTANTIFHRVRFGVRTAFFICFEMATTTKSLSTTQMGVRYGITEKTARLFMLKVREAMSSSENHPMNGNIQVDEFVLGRYKQGKIGRSYNAKKKKAVTAVEFTDDGKVKRMYALNIKDFSARSLQYMFIKHIDRSAKVTTNKWKGYIPITKAYEITQIDSDKGLNFKALQL